MDMRENLAERETVDVQKTTTDSPAAENVVEAAESTQKQPQTTGEVIEKIIEVSAKDASEISREEVSHLKMLFYSIRNARNAAKAEGEADETEKEPVAEADPEEEKLKEALAVIREKKAELVKEIEARQLENLRKKNEIVDEINAASEDTDNVGKLFNRVKELQEQFKAVGDVPQTNATEIWKKYQEAVELFYDRLKINKELRDYDFRKNLEQKELILSQAKELDGNTDVVVAFRMLQDLHDKWREIGPVAKEFREKIWADFKEVSASINKKYQAFFEERKAREAHNESAKTALCERLEAIDLKAIDSFKAWEAATADVLAIQAEWKTLGYASRKSNNSLYERYRKLCDDFFAAKANYYKEVKENLEENLRKKTLLVEEAEKLAQSDDFKTVTDRIVAMQKEWKTIGSVPKKVSDAIWKRFTAACDTFFDRKKQANSSVRTQEQANLAAKKEIIERLKGITDETPKQEGAKILRDAMAEWGKIGHVPFREKDKVYASYRELVDALYESLDMRGNGASMNRFQENISKLEGDEKAVLRERERLVRAYESRKNELSTAENNLGFFTSKSRSGNSMIKEAERRIQRLKEEIEQLEQKIKIIDSKL